MIAAAALSALILAGAVFPRASAAADFGITLPKVKRIDIVGNKSFPAKVLKKHMRTGEAHFYKIFRQPEYRRDFLRRDVEALASFYHANGFLEARVKIDTVMMNPQGSWVKIRIGVKEGPRTTVRKLAFAGQSLIPEAKLREGLRLVEGAPYTPSLVEVDRYALFNKFFERGYLGATITAEVKTDSTRVSIAWSITPREPVAINRVRVEGNRKVKEKYVRRELTFKRGELFGTKKVLDSTQNLYDTGYFTSVEIKPESLYVDRRVVDLGVQVRERRMGYIEGGFGVGNVQGNQITAEWGQRDLFGLGLAFDAKSSYAFQLFPNNQFSVKKIDFRSKFMRHQGQLDFPHILGTWNTFSLGAFYVRDATVAPIIVKDRALTVSLFRRFTRQTSLIGSYSIERVQRFEVEEERLRSRRRALDALFTRDSRDSYFNPLRGMYITGEGVYTGGFLGGQDYLYSFVGAVQRYAKLPTGSVFAYRVRGGYADTFGRSRATGLPVENRFFAGGGNSVRGFKENSLGPLNSELQPLGGRVLLLTNVELRFPLPLLSKLNFGGALFLDGGNVWNSVGEIGGREFRLAAKTKDTTRKDYMYGTGFGVRYYTPVGPIRIDVGFPLKRPPQVDYDYWVHISLGQIF